MCKRTHRERGISFAEPSLAERLAQGTEADDKVQFVYRYAPAATVAPSPCTAMICPFDCSPRSTRRATQSEVLTLLASGLETLCSI